MRSKRTIFIVFWGLDKVFLEPTLSVLNEGIQKDKEANMRYLSPFFNSKSNDWVDFDRFFSIPSFSGLDINKPVYDFEEGKDHYIFSFDLPGIGRENLSVDLRGNALEISAHRKTQESDRNKTIDGESRQVGFFKKTLSLPEAVDLEKIEAHYEDGVLRVLLPKKEKAAPQKIEIKTKRSDFFKRLMHS